MWPSIFFNQWIILFVLSFPMFLVLCYSRDPSRFLGPFILDYCISMAICTLLECHMDSHSFTISLLPSYFSLNQEVSLFLLRPNVPGSPVWISGNSKCSTADCKMQMRPESSCSVSWFSSSSGYQPSSSHVSPSRGSLGQPPRQYLYVICTNIESA